MTQLSTHVLDTVTGRPAAGVAVTLADAAGTTLASAATDGDGRIAGLSTGELSGVYRLTFDTGAYFASIGVSGFYPEVIIAVEITEPAGRYHVPLLVSPYAYCTYRGS